MEKSSQNLEPLHKNDLGNESRVQMSLNHGKSVDHFVKLPLLSREKDF